MIGLFHPENPGQYDVREIIARIVDDSQFSEFKKNYGKILSEMLKNPLRIIEMQKNSLKTAELIKSIDQMTGNYIKLFECLA